MKTFSRIAVAALAGLAPVAAYAADKTFELEPFTSIEISSGINAVVTVGGTAQSVTATSPTQEELDELIVEVRGGKLTASKDWNLLDLFDFGAGESQTLITINVPTLDAAAADSGADVTIAGIGGDLVTLRSSSGSDLDITGATGRRYDIDSSSGSDLTIEGTCESAKVNSSSGSNVRADKLLCADVDANSSSGSDADVYATASVKAEASSGADITVYGKPPAIEQNASSGADINIR